MSEFDLTDDQKAAMAAFAHFMLSDESEMVISGQAGVGKTTLLAHLFNERPHEKLAKMIRQPVLTNWHFTATTNKAAEVLSQSLDYEATTIHSLLSLRVYNDIETGKTKITRRGDADVITDSIIIIDEASMVDTQLLSFIRKGTFRCKIVFIGDHCQMAPVMEPNSPMFFNSDPVFINQIVRSKGTPPITALSKQLRQIVETGEFTPILEVPGTIDYLNSKEAEELIRNKFHSNETDSRILCYTNATVVAYNRHIRNLRGLPEEPSPGEHLITNNAVKIGKRMLHIEQEIVINKNLGESEFRPTDTNLLLPVHLVDTNAGVLSVPVNGQDYQNMIKQCARQKNWPAYFSLKELVADLRPRDACTVYKAQGSTYRDVFVNLTDIGKCTNPSQAARMLYVACTRPTHNIYFIGQLPERFQGK